MKEKFLATAIVFITIISFLSCKKNDAAVNTAANVKRLVVVYMVADNNLDYFAVQNINEMEKGFDSATFNGKLLVFVDRASNATPSHPYMMEIVHDTTDAIASKIIYTYPEQNTARGSVLTSVIQDAKNYYPNYTNIGLVLWSHGTAWLPKGVHVGTKRGQIIDTTKSFGLDECPIDSSVMDIKELATGLKNTNYYFEILDTVHFAGQCYLSLDTAKSTPAINISNGTYPLHCITHSQLAIDANIQIKGSFQNVKISISPNGNINIQ